MEYTIMKVTTFKNGKKFANILGNYDNKKKLTDMIIKDFSKDDIEANLKEISTLSADIFNKANENKEHETEFFWNTDDLLLTYYISRLTI